VARSWYETLRENIARLIETINPLSRRKRDAATPIRYYCELARSGALKHITEST